MKIIKFALPYHAFLPPVAVLEEALAASPYVAPLPDETRSYGFTTRTPSSTRLVSEFEGGFAFFLRIDEKIVPSAAIATGLREAVEKTYQETGRYPGRKERLELRDQVVLDCRRKALVKSTSIGCFYQPSTRYLLLSTPSERLAEIVIKALLETVEGFRVEHIVTPHLGTQMADRLRLWTLDEEEKPFDEFELGTELMLVGAKKKLTIKTNNIERARQAITEALGDEYTFKLARLEHDNGLSFRLDESFHLKSLLYAETPEAKDANDASTVWQHEASIQLMFVTQAVADLITMFNVQLELQP